MGRPRDPESNNSRTRPSGPEPLCECHSKPMGWRAQGSKQGRWRCRVQEAAYQRAWQLRHPDRNRAHYQRANWRKAGINLTPEQFQAILAGQGDCCGLCGRADPGSKGWHADHDHDTGRVRGVLCGDCNRGLGLLGDNLEGVKRAMNYLLNPPTIGQQS